MLSCATSPDYTYKVYQSDTYTRVAILNYKPVTTRTLQIGLRDIFEKEGLDSAYIFIDALTISKNNPDFTREYFSDQSNLERLKTHSYDTARLLSITEIGVGKFTNELFSINKYADSAYLKSKLIL